MTGRFSVLAERLNSGMTQRELAAACEVSLTTIQRLEAGAGANPRNAKKVADWFSTDERPVLVTDLLPVEDVAA